MVSSQGFIFASQKAFDVSPGYPDFGDIMPGG
jgi:hypothetical protein